VFPEFVLLPEVEVSTKMTFENIISVKVIIILSIKNKSVSKMVITIKQFPGTVGLYKVPQTRRPKCTQQLSADPIGRVSICRAFFLFWLTYE
jgi:hypothetical protein